MGAVITTPELADSFNNGMEFFSTFGGNPVACAAGLAVLDVLREENLQANAREVGRQLLEGLRRLMAKHTLVGDVRGVGLFLGIELVRDRKTLEPATAETAVRASLGTTAPHSGATSERNNPKAPAPINSAARLGRNITPAFAWMR